MKFISANNGLRVLFYSLTLASFPCSALARAHASPLGAAYFQQTITGTVSDASGPLPGVTVMVKGTARSTVTDAGGKFSIAAANDEVLQFVFIGYKNTEAAVGSQNSVDVLLTLDATQLEEVAINAGYYSVKQRESTGNIARVTARDIETQPVSNALATLQGRMPGVSITQSSGVPGSGFDIKIRGANSLRSAGNNPLYIIDGVPYSSDPIGNTQTAQVLPSATSPLSSINPDQIASIEILKDADATAIYGSRGANGVVLVTTKKGNQGATRYAINYNSGFGSVTRFADLMNTTQYLAMRREAYANDGITEYGPYDYDVNGSWDQARYTDWQKELLGGTSKYTNATASISGGSMQTQFLLSGGLFNESSVMSDNFKYKKVNVHANINHASKDEKFKVAFTAGYTNQNNNQPGLDLTYTARSLAPNAPELYDGTGNLNWEGGTFINPLARLEGKYEAKTNDLIASSLFRYQFLTYLSASVNAGFTDLRHNESTTAPHTMYNPLYGYTSAMSSIDLTNTNRQSWIVEPQVNFEKEYGRLIINALVGATFQEQKSQSQTLNGNGFTNNSLITNLASASYVTVLNSLDTEYRYNAVFGRFNAKWDSRYLLNLTARRDGSSRFGPGKRFANFGAVGAAWIFSEQSWLKDNSILSFGKVRTSYGTTGSDQIGDYQYLNTYTSSSGVYDGIIGLTPSRLFNPLFGWEMNKKFEAGLELGFFKNRLYLTGSFYRNRSSSQLVGIPMPATTGFTSIQANLNAVVENRGWEISVRSENIKSDSFEWSSSINLTLPENKLVSFPDLAGSTYRNQYVIGQATNIQKLYEVTGVDTQTGVYTFKDFNGDGIITSDDRQAVRNLNPSIFGGLQNNIKYKGVSFDFLFQFVKQENLNLNAMAGMPGTMVNQPTKVLDRWTMPGVQSNYQQYSSGSNQMVAEAYQRFSQSTATVSDASFIRLKNIALSYQLPERVFKNIQCKIFIQGQNLLTITNFSGGDPEFTQQGYLPPLKTLTTGLQLSF